MRRYFSSIRGVLTLTIGALTLIITLLAGKATLENWQKLDKLSQLKNAIVSSDALFNAVETFSVEHDIALSMLRSAERDTIDDLRTRLNETRIAADNALRTALASIEGFGFSELAALRSNASVRLAGIQNLRKEIDRELALPKELRSAELQQRWSAEATALTTRTQDLSDGFMAHFTSIDPTATLHLRFRNFVRRLIQYGSSERSIIGQLIADNQPPTAAQVSELLRRRGASELAWQMARLNADQSGLFHLVASAYNDASSQQATMYEMIQDMFYVPGTKREAPYPIGVDLWFELSSQASDSLVALRDAASRETRAYAQRLIETSQREITIQGLVFFIALLLCVYSFWIVVERVVRPIEKIIDALVRATRGEPVAMAASGRSDEIGKLENVLHAFQNASQEVVRAAVEVERSRSELRAVVDHAVDGLVTINALGIVLSFNPACEKIFGYAASDVVGKNIAMLMPDSQSDDIRYLARFMEAGDGPGREFSAKRKDGTTFPIDLSISAFTLEGVQHFSGIVRDITERKEAERALLQYTQALERSNKELDDFAYIASHDLKEPLRGIHNHARFLLEDNAERLDQDSAGRLNRLVYLSQRMERLVNDLLYFSRLGRQELAIQNTDLSAVIADVESTLEQFLQERGAKIVLPQLLPHLVCDKPRVTELFRNLITNAVKYNDKTEKIIEIGFAATQRTALGALMRNVLYVKDNGRGIDREFHSEIFRIFKRLQANKETEEGTGVGLTFVKKIVERHGGKIWVESEVGKGATFFFTLEATPHEREHDAQAAA